MRDMEGIKTLHCMNSSCIAKHISSFSHFVSKQALDIEGLSEQTIEKLIDAGLISQFSDIFTLHTKKAQLLTLEGFKEKSTENLLKAIENARKTSPSRLLNSLGISGIGKANAKLISTAFNDNINAIRTASSEDFSKIPGVGPILAEAIFNYFRVAENISRLDTLLSQLSLSSPKQLQSLNKSINSKTFVITGKLDAFKSRDDLVEKIEAQGGKVASSVSKNTNYLINNDISSASSKNKKANELGVKIINEAEILELLGEIL
jgi:DNA ligase (NAD+)